MTGTASDVLERPTVSPADLLKRLRNGESVDGLLVKGGSMRAADFTGTTRAGKPHDLSGLAFIGVDLTNAKFDGVAGHDIAFVDCTLDGSSHADADYSFADPLKGSLIVGGTAMRASLARTTMTRGRIQGVRDMTLLDATDGIFNEATVDHNHAPQSTWTRARFNGDAHFCHNDLTGGTIIELKIAKGCMVGTTLNHVDGTGMVGPGTNMSHVSAIEFRAPGAVLDGVQMIDMEWIRGVVSPETSLRKVNIFGAVTTDTPLYIADTTGMTSGRTKIQVSDFTPQRHSKRMQLVRPALWYKTRGLPVPEELRPELVVPATDDAIHTDSAVVTLESPKPFVVNLSPQVSDALVADTAAPEATPVAKPRTGTTGRAVSSRSRARDPVRTTRSGAGPPTASRTGHETTTAPEHPVVREPGEKAKAPGKSAPD